MIHVFYFKLSYLFVMCVSVDTLILNLDLYFLFRSVFQHKPCSSLAQKQSSFSR